MENFFVDITNKSGFKLIPFSYIFVKHEFEQKLLEKEQIIENLRKIYRFVIEDVDCLNLGGIDLTLRLKIKERENNDIRYLARVLKIDRSNENTTFFYFEPENRHLIIAKDLYQTDFYKECIYNKLKNKGCKNEWICIKTLSGGFQAIISNQLNEAGGNFENTNLYYYYDEMHRYVKDEFFGKTPEIVQREKKEHIEFIDKKIATIELKLKELFEEQQQILNKTKDLTDMIVRLKAFNKNED